MALEESILDSVKKNLGLAENYDAFDHDVLTHINTTFFNLNQLGIGPAAGFVVEDETTKWSDFADSDLNVAALNALQTYIFLKVRMYFDPPGTSHHITAMKEQIDELEHRLLTERDLVKWLPSSSPSLP
jgi:hypothetical protein